MTTKDEALKQALDALEFSKSYLDDLADVHGTSKKAKPGSTSWHVDRAITACREALAQKDDQEPVAWKRRLVEIHDALSYELGDTDPHIEDDMTDEEVREEMPVFWAAKEVATLIGDAPWDSLPSASPKLQPLTDEEVSELSRTMVKENKSVNWLCRVIEAAHGIGVEHDAG